MKLLMVDNSPAPGGSVHHMASFANVWHGEGVAMRIIATHPEFFLDRVPIAVPVTPLDVPHFNDPFGALGSVFEPVLPGPLNWPFSWWDYRRFARRVRRAFGERIETYAPDAVYINNLNLPNRPFADECVARGLPFVVGALMIREFGRRELQMARDAAAVFCISRGVAKCVGEAAPDLAPESLVVTDSGVEPGRYDVARNPAIRAGLGVPDDAAMVLSLGRMIEWKGHDVLVRALGKVRQTVPNLWFVQAGGEVPEWREKVRAIAEQVGMADRMVLAGQREDVPDLLAACDVLAHSSKYGDAKTGVVEAFGRVIAEGLAAGRPVVATRAGGAVEILERAGCGTLAAPGDVDGMAEAITSYLTDRSLATRDSEIGREAALAYEEHVIGRKALTALRRATGIAE
ncbi:MAG: glycosyltransferase [Deltaproteobacteria bacterium]|nr:glycosyltransferase [Deltaproteobacteria bacterium]MCB9480049.1 glycosyltransferase [Deltaproteobacteria bacterium]